MINNNVNVHPQMNRRPTNKREGELSAAISLAQKNLPDTPSTGEDTAQFEERLDDDATTAEGSQLGMGSGLGMGMGMGMTGQSDDMMFALLASQAAVDCERLPIGAWEDVESWKKVSAVVSTNYAWAWDVQLMMACRNCRSCRIAWSRSSPDTNGRSRSSQRRGRCRSLTTRTSGCPSRPWRVSSNRRNA
jgi:hypothetical protein